MYLDLVRAYPRDFLELQDTAFLVAMWADWQNTSSYEHYINNPDSYRQKDGNITSYKPTFITELWQANSLTN